ncbi:hypothetical protein F5148DRAFT_986865, partial [Russula earlei]
QLSNQIKNSLTLILPCWKEAIKELTPTSDENLTVCKMPWDVCTWWNSTYNILRFAYKYWEVANKITSKWSLKLWKYELSEGKWDLVKELQDCLKVLKSLMLVFSSDMPCLTTVIPAMDHMHSELQSMSSNYKKHGPALCMALTLGLNLLDKYNSLMDHSEVYRIAIILHPCYKLQYFKKHEWDEEWIRGAERIICDEFKCTYSNYVIPKTLAPHPSKKSKSKVCDTYSV